MKIAYLIIMLIAFSFSCGCQINNQTTNNKITHITQQAGEYTYHFTIVNGNKKGPFETYLYTPLNHKKYLVCKGTYLNDSTMMGNYTFYSSKGYALFKFINITLNIDTIIAPPVIIGNNDTLAPKRPYFPRYKFNFKLYYKNSNQVKVTGVFYGNEIKNIYLDNFEKGGWKYPYFKGSIFYYYSKDGKFLYSK